MLIRIAKSSQSNGILNSQLLKNKQSPLHGAFYLSILSGIVSMGLHMNKMEENQIESKGPEEKMINSYLKNQILFK